MKFWACVILLFASYVITIINVWIKQQIAAITLALWVMNI